MVVWNVAVSSASAPRATVSSAKVSHYLCYSVNEVANSAAPGFAKTPTSVILKNGLQASPFLATLTTPAGAPGTPDVHCNPALKVTQKGKYPILNKNAHLLCWTIGTKATKGSVTVTNQFGSGVFDYANANELCLPTWKSLTGRRRRRPSRRLVSTITRATPASRRRPRRSPRRPGSPSRTSSARG